MQTFFLGEEELQIEDAIFFVCHPLSFPFFVFFLFIIGQCAKRQKNEIQITKQSRSIEIILVHRTS